MHETTMKKRVRVAFLYFSPPLPVDRRPRWAATRSRVPLRRGTPEGLDVYFDAAAGAPLRAGAPMGSTAIGLPGPADFFVEPLIGQCPGRGVVDVSQ